MAKFYSSSESNRAADRSEERQHEWTPDIKAGDKVRSQPRRELSNRTKKRDQDPKPCKQ